MSEEQTNRLRELRFKPELTEEETKELNKLSVLESKTKIEGQPLSNDPVE
jgi:hypothetical protein